MMRVKIILEKIKIRLCAEEVKNLIKHIELKITEESQSKFEIANIHASWMALLKEVSVLLLDKPLDKEPLKEYKFSFTESQYFALLELYQHPCPDRSLSFEANNVMAKLLEFGINKNLIKAGQDNQPIPLLNPIHQDIKLLE